MNLGFVDMGGKIGLKNRQVFSEFFFYDRLQTLKQPMYAIAQRQIKDFVENQNINNSEFKNIDLKESLLEKIVLDIITLILFGFSSSEDLLIDLSEHPEIANGSYQENLHTII